MAKPEISTLSEDEIRRLSPPQNLHFEQAVLGAMIIEPQVIDPVRAILKPTYFYRNSHRAIYGVLLKMYDTGTPIDLMTLANELKLKGWLEKVQGYPYLVQLTDSLATATHAEAYAEGVKDVALLRMMWTSGEILKKAAHDPFDDIQEHLSATLQSVDETMEHAAQASETFSPMQEVIDSAFTRMENQADGKIDRGIPTGFTWLDRLLGGMKPGQLIFLAARPGVGKSALSANIAANVCDTGKHVAMFSLEMTKDEIGYRLISSTARIDVNKTKMGTRDWEAIGNACSKLSQIPFYICDNAGITPGLIRASLRGLKRNGNLDLVIVDYLQILTPDRPTHDEMKDILQNSRTLKRMAMELKVPILVMSAMNRAQELRTNKEPVLSDIRQAGEADADTVIFLWPDKEPEEKDDDKQEDVQLPQTINFKIGKNRSYRTGKGQLVYHPYWTRFDTIDERREEPPTAQHAHYFEDD